MFKKLHILLIFSILVVTKPLRSNHRMRNLTAIFAKFLEICKDFSSNLVNESGNVPRRGVVPKFSDLTVFSQLNDQFMLLRNYAKHQEGLFTRIINKISAFTVLQYINHINNKPIGRVKYALI
ncbi:MAG: hypothetical protein MJZ83_03320 [Bacteroidaceae bacterium]|nr:hypothetical protein [Bacteroidaceae bacterium]